jgi:hypothetical protein
LHVPEDQSVDGLGTIALRIRRLKDVNARADETDRIHAVLVLGPDLRDSLSSSGLLIGVEGYVDIIPAEQVAAPGGRLDWSILNEHWKAVMKKRGWTLFNVTLSLSAVEETLPGKRELTHLLGLESQLSKALIRALQTHLQPADFGHLLDLMALAARAV